MDEWHDVGGASDLSDDTPLAASIGGNEIGVYVVGDRYYAMENVCPHAYALLSQGFVEGEEIECPLHGARKASVCSSRSIDLSKKGERS